MLSPASLFRTLRAFFHNRRLEDRLRDELQLHVDMLAEKNMRLGMPPHVAVREARIAVGGFDQTRETVRDARGFGLFDEVARNTRYAFRQFRRNPGFTVVVVLVLALGIGANTAIFSVLDALLLRRAPLAAFDRLVMLWETDRQTGTTREPASLPDFLDVRERARKVDRIGVMTPGRRLLVRRGGQEEELPAGFAHFR